MNALALPAPRFTASYMEEGPVDQVIRVLIVDDCPDTRSSLRMLLEMWGHEVRDAQDGPTALQAAIDFHPDVVLLDIGLPGLDGYQVARRLRRLPGLVDVLLVAATGYGQERDVTRSREAGFHLHMLKPFDLGKLERLLNSCRTGFRCRTIPDRMCSEVFFTAS